MLRPVMTESEFIDVSIGRGMMQVVDRIGQRRQLVVPRQFGGQPVRQAAGAEQGQGLLAQLAQALLGQAFGERVDRGQGFIDGRWFVAGDGAVFRVVDLKPRSAGPGFAIAAHAGATFQAFLLCVAEVIEAQAQAPGAVLQAHYQAAPPAHDHVGTADGAFDHGVLSRAQVANRDHAGAVLVAQRQMEQDVLQVLQADLGQLFGHGLADTLECRDRHVRQLSHG
ncbi:hypothetical protein D3C84_437940 [compost metagenome]